jgi:hypothetical protein
MTRRMDEGSTRIVHPSGESEVLLLYCLTHPREIPAGLSGTVHIEADAGRAGEGYIYYVVMPRTYGTGGNAAC